MGQEFRYVLPVGETGWTVEGETSTGFRWDYDAAGAALLGLYDKGKRQQWDAAGRIDWSLDLDPENPALLDDRAISIFGSDIWNRMTDKERANLRRHGQAWQISQFLHGEQGALVCAAKIVQQVPAIDAKYFAATQVMDEARHVEAYSRLLREKFELAFPITPPLKSLLANVVSDGRWDMTYLGMQVLIEGLALAAFQVFRDDAKNPLFASINSYVMQDEARHVAFGRLALRDYYPELGTAERREREEFVIASCHLMRDRFLADELWECVGLPRAECVAIGLESERMRKFRARLFTRIVPMIRDIGLWSREVQSAFAEMGVLQYAEVDLGAVLEQDAAVAQSFDAGRGGRPAT